MQPCVVPRASLHASLAGLQSKHADGCGFDVVSTATIHVYGRVINLGAVTAWAAAVPGCAAFLRPCLYVLQTWGGGRGKGERGGGLHQGTHILSLNLPPTLSHASPSSFSLPGTSSDNVSIQAPVLHANIAPFFIQIT